MTDDDIEPQNPKSPPEVWAKLKPLAREKRKDPTDAEDFLWQLLGTRPAGMKFRRQHSIDTQILDFYCIKARLAIEVDGTSHDGREADDEYRDSALRGVGIRTLRFSNDEVLNDIESVLRRIEAAGSGEA